MSQQRTHWFLLLILLALVIAGCVNTSQEDRRRLAALEEKFGAGYAFNFSPSGIYLNAVSKSPTLPTEQEAKEIFRSFWLDNGRPRDSEYIYLNIYDSSNNFLFQIHWDPRSQDLVVGRVEHY